MHLDDKLAAAFAAWSDAKDELDALRRELSGHMPGGTQLAAGPQAKAKFKAVQTQMKVCEQAFDTLVRTAEERADHLERAAALQLQARLQAGPAAPASAAPPAGPAPPSTDPPGDSPEPA